MKKLAVSVLFMLLVFSNQSCSENKLSPSDVPTTVVSAFNAKYPNARDVEWEKDQENGKTLYEVECKINGKEVKAKFNLDGSFVKEEND